MMMMVFETGSTLVQCLCSSPVHKAVCQLLNLGILDFQTLFLFPSSDKHHVFFFFFPITASTFLLICCLHNINLIKLFTTLFLKTCPSKKIDYLASASLCSQPSNFFIYRWCPDFTFFLQSTEDGKLSLDLIPMPATLFPDYFSQTMLCLYILTQTPHLTQKWSSLQKSAQEPGPQMQPGSTLASLIRQANIFMKRQGNSYISEE